jgi:low temperature requirement protein LtrA
MEVRLLLFAMMGGALLMSIALPEAFGPRALVFALSYVGIQLGRHLFMLFAMARRSRENFIGFVRIILWTMIESAFWIAGALADPAQRLALWGAAILILNIAPTTGYWLPGLGRSETTAWDIEGHHFSERCGLFIIIALGESIVVAGSSFGRTNWDLPAIAAFASAFLGTLAMWWLYFDIGADRAARKLVEDKDPGRMARLAYTYFHIPIVAGIIVTAASDEMVLAHPDGHASMAAIAALLGGPALYLSGNLIFKRTNALHFPLSHLVGLALLCAILPFATHLSPLQLSLVATGVLVLVAAWESWSLRETRAALKS